MSDYRKSSFCHTAGNCVEVSHSQVMDHVHVRDSKDPEGPELEFSRAEWEAFALGVKAGEFDIASPGAVQPSKFARLSVNINDECAQALREVKAKRGFSTTEAIRRAIGLLDYFERSRPSVESTHRSNEACLHCGSCAENGCLRAALSGMVEHFSSVPCNLNTQQWEVLSNARAALDVNPEATS